MIIALALASLVTAIIFAILIIASRADALMQQHEEEQQIEALIMEELERELFDSAA